MSCTAPKSIEIRGGENMPSMLGTTTTEIRTSSWSCSGFNLSGCLYFDDDEEIYLRVALLCSPDRHFENSIS